MRLMWNLIAGLALVATSCTSPLTGLVGGPPLGAIGTGETQLVFHLASARSVDYGYTSGAVGYLVIQLQQQSGQGTKTLRSAAAVVSEGTATVGLRGLAGGPWTLQASLYDDDGADGTAPTLLFTARQTVAIVSGASTPVTLLLYQPGDLSSLSLSLAVLVNTVVLTDTDNATEAHVPLGGRRQLSASALAVSSGLASEQRFVWTSDHPEVASVNSAGVVVAKTIGKATITATSVESQKTGVLKAAAYTFWSEPTIYGRWHWDIVPTATYGASHDLNIYRDAAGQLRFDSIYTNHDGINRYYDRSRGRAEFSVENWHLVFEELISFDHPERGWVSSIEVNANRNYMVVEERKGSLVWENELDRIFQPQTAWAPFTGASLSLPANPVVAEIDQPEVVVEGAPSVPHLYWGTSDPTIATIHRFSGQVTYLGTGPVTFTAYSLENPGLTVGSVTRSADTVATLVPTFSLAAGAFGTQATLVQVVPDKVETGKWLASGTDADGVPFYLRLNHDGSQDTGFAGGGSIHANPSTTTSIPRGVGVFQDQASGNVYLTSLHQTGVGNTWITQFDPSGTPVPNMATPWGYITNSVPVSRVARGTNGNLYQFGSYDGATFLWHLDANGTAAQVGESLNGTVEQVLLVGGSAVFLSTGNSWSVVPLGTGEAYGDTLWVQTPEGSENPSFVAGATASPTTAIFLGRFDAYNPDTDDYEYRSVVARLNLTTGGLDPNFGGADGYRNQPTVFVLPAAFSHATDITVAADGRIFVVGDTTSDSFGTSNRAWVAEVASDGRAFRPLFRDGDATVRSSPVAVSTDANNKLLVVGFRAEGSNLRQPAIWSF